MSALSEVKKSGDPILPPPDPYLLDYVSISGRAPIQPA